MTHKARRFSFSILITITVLLSSTIAYAASYNRVAGLTWSQGGGVTTQWGGNASIGQVKAKSEVTRSWYNIFSASMGKTQVIACKTVTPSFTGNARIKTTMVLNGELRTESKSFWKVPGGQANADLQLLIQVAKTKVYNQGLMFVGSQLWMPHSKSYNNETRSFEITYYVTKGQPVEICGGIMTNASVLFGGGNAISDFYSSRYAPTIVKDIILMK